MNDRPRPAQTPPGGTAGRLLRAAAVVVGLEAVAFTVVAILGIAEISDDTVGIGLGAGILLILYAAGLVLAAALVVRGRAAARAPIVVAQLIQVLLAWDARDGAAWASPLLAVTALVVLGCLLAPPVTRALSADGLM